MKIRKLWLWKIVIVPGKADFTRWRNLQNWFLWTIDFKRWKNISGYYFTLKKLTTPQFWFIYDCLHPKVGILFAGGQSQAKNWSYFFVVVAVLGRRKVWKSGRASRNHQGILKENVLLLLRGSSHIQSVLIVIKYQNCHRTLDLYLLVTFSMGQIQSKPIYKLVT